MIPNWLPQRAALTPNKIAFTFNKQQWTFAELHNISLSTAKKLRSIHLQTGDRVALLGSSNPEMVFMIHACMLAGFEIVFLNSRLTKTEITWQINDAEVKTIFVDDAFHSLIQSTKVPVFTFTNINENKEQPFEIQSNWESNQTISIMYTSGTTGFPKGVRQSVGNHVSSALSSVLNLGLNEEDVWLCAMPLFHISGFSILVRSVIYGMEIRLYEKFDAKQVANEISEGTITRISVVSKTLENILTELETTNRTAHPSFLSMLVGGGTVPESYLMRAEKLNIPVLQTYGMTETSSQTATLSAADAIRKRGSAGKPLFFNQIKINGAKASGDVGEVFIRGPHITPGYIGQFSDVDPLVDGWFATGDIGYLDEEGYLYIIDRRSDLIISGGENIYPAEIENTLAGHPNIVEAGVCGKEDEQWGSVPVAFVVANQNVTVEELEAFCAQHLARYKIPKAFHFVEKLPRNASNKLLRRELKEWLEQ